MSAAVPATTMDRDVLVLGAGIVGVSAALHLQRRGRSVALVDRRGPGEETSYGNAGLIERASVLPAAFPRRLSELLRYMLNTSPQARYHVGFLRRGLPWLAQYWRHSAPERLEAALRGALPLVEGSVREHADLSAGTGAEPFYRKDGWIKLYRTDRGVEEARSELSELTSFGLRCDLLDSAGLKDREPAITPLFKGAMHMLDAWTVTSPGAVTKALASQFATSGGDILVGDARSLSPCANGWTLTTQAHQVTARQVVVALGPWSAEFCQGFGYAFPMAVKRGYHMTYEAAHGPNLKHPVADVDNGFALAPMIDGIRLTTGIEFALRDAVPTPVQLEKSERAARQFFPLGARVQPEPWMGCRPCMSDMLPVIGSAPRHKGLWFCFGHGHLGFTLAPISGRLLAEMMTAGEPCADPAPYRADRFN